MFSHCAWVDGLGNGQQEHKVDMFIWFSFTNCIYDMCYSLAIIPNRIFFLFFVFDCVLSLSQIWYKMAQFSSLWLNLLNFILIFERQLNYAVSKLSYFTMFLQSHTSCPGIYLKTYLSNTSTYVIRYSILKYKHISTKYILTLLSTKTLQKSVIVLWMTIESIPKFYMNTHLHVHFHISAL